MLKPKQIKKLGTAKIVEESDRKLLSNIEKTKLTELTAKSVPGCKVFTVTTASLSFSTVATNNFSTTAQAYTWPTPLPNDPQSVLVKITTDVGSYTPIVTAKSTTGFSVKFKTCIGTTSKIFGIEIIVLY